MLECTPETPFTASFICSPLTWTVAATEMLHLWCDRWCHSREVKTERIKPHLKTTY